MIEFLEAITEEVLGRIIKKFKLFKAIDYFFVLFFLVVVFVGFFNYFK